MGAGTTRDEAVHVMEQGLADGVVVGRAVIANPDLVQRWGGDHPVNTADPTTFYGAGAEVYTHPPPCSSAAPESVVLPSEPGRQDDRNTLIHLKRNSMGAD